MKKKVYKQEVRVKKNICIYILVQLSANMDLQFKLVFSSCRNISTGS